MYGCLWIVVRDCEWSIEPILKVTRSENDTYNGVFFFFFHLLTQNGSRVDIKKKKKSILEC